MTPRHFKNGAEFGKWLAKNHAKADELWVGFHKKDSGKPSITWPESVDEALCYGWIDGIRKSLGEVSYVIRFTPRRAGSIWSTVNVNRVTVLVAEGRMQPAGAKAFAARKAGKSGIYSFEQRIPAALPKECVAALRKDKAAWKFHGTQPPSYIKAVAWWIVSAKKDETRVRRIALLVKCSAAGERIPQFTWKKSTT
ncbi:YdeI/OmpD-associated family protein [Usitatibacter palustris]|uniref:Bacteriocin-protection protein n=1 Tax=Usitatibacter palustris TaxID=2732487 RepID=A0A6M4H6K8_9PROT|nr:YdeI/OmpD-associated family protein [Usitatibacter palustris]QJR13587.1 hypothetical protein DSM104440_00371 [Usitatibacter palustris]